MNPALLTKTQGHKLIQKKGVKFADLHLHSFFSDGTYTPEELIKEASKQKLSAISLVDHDTVDGVGVTIELAKSVDLEILPGVELTAEYEALEIHILGYLIDYKNKDLIDKLDYLQKNRVGRIYKIIDKLKNIGIELKPEAVFEIAKGGSVGRLHIARAMVKQGLVSSAAEAFGRFIGDKCPAYISGFKLSPQEAIKLIKGVGGIPVLAHPYSVKKDELIAQLVDYGLMGLEVYYPEHTQSMVNFYLGIAEKFDLLVTGGSDCHGDAKAYVRIGSVKIPYALVEKLKQAKETLSTA